MPRFNTIEEIIVATAEAVRPSERLTVSQAAEKYRWLNNPGHYVGPWDNSVAPYLVDIMDTTMSLDHTAVVFVGPARCGKSDIFFNLLAYTAICDPADMMSVDMTQNTARDWSKGDLQRALRTSTALGSRVKPGRQNNNVHDIEFMSGMRLLVKWPTISELSGKTIPRLWIRDYDRLDQNVDGEGNPFDLTRKRAQTFGRYGMCVAESSPGFPIEDSKWQATTPHEAPPTKGILALYNRGDRRRWYWSCVQCAEPFEAHFKYMQWPDGVEAMEAAEQAVMVCPSCGFPHEDKAHKHTLNLSGRWIADGQTWNADGSVSGTPRRSNIASYWLLGPAAAFTSWQDIVFKLLQAQDEYDRNGSEEALKTTINVDQGLPYTPKTIEAGRVPDELQNRAEDWGSSADFPVVPEGTRFLIKTIDVQARSFVIQTHAFTSTGDIFIIEMRKVRKSDEVGDDGERLPIDPASRPEDWQQLIPEIEQTYPLADGSGRHMRLKIVGCDSGGKEGVTPNAYAFWRYLRDDVEGRGLHHRFHLIKGTVSKGAPRLAVTYPDSKQRSSRNARGEVPVQLVNTNDVKDMANGMLGRTETGKVDGSYGMVRFPSWAESWLYSQLTTEIKQPSGWVNRSRKRNEAWDLLVYAIALSLHISVRFEHIKWAEPPTWADEWDRNILVFDPNGPVDPLTGDDDGNESLESLASQLA